MQAKTDLDIQVSGVFVEVPDGCVVAVGDEITRYPVAPPRLTTPPGDYTRHQRRRTDVEL